MIKAVIYKRVSTKLQVDKYSLPAQEKILKECIAKEGHKLVEIYSDEGISGERMADRPAFMRLLNDADSGKFNEVWVIDQNRLSRGDIAELSYIKKVFKDNNIIICTPYQKLNLDDIEDDFISNLFGIIAERERKKIKESADRGRKEQFERGEWGGRLPPYGYDFDTTKSKFLTINKQEARVYRQIVSLYLEKGYGTRLIAKELNKKGLKGRCGGNWSDRSIHYMLRNPVYKGLVVYKKYKKYLRIDDKYGWKTTKEFLSVKGKHEPLLSEETFDLIQQRLTRNRNKNRLLYHIQLLTGLLECTKCHNTFRIGSTGGPGHRKRVYRCKTRFAHWFNKRLPNCKMSAFGVEEYNKKIWDKVQQVARRPDIIRKALLQSYKPEKENIKLYKEEFDDLKKDIDKYETRRNRAISMRVNGLINEDELRSQLIKLKEEHNKALSRWKEISVKISFIEENVKNNIDEKTILKYAKYLYQSERKLDLYQKRRILEAFVSRISVYKDGKFKIVFKFPIPSEPLTFDGLMKKITSEHTIAQTGGPVEGRHIK